MRTRLEWKVGLFVFICLVLLAALLVEFSKGMSLFRSTYSIVLESSNVSGLAVSAPVMMSGVQVGRVSRITLAPSGKTAIVNLTIYSQYPIHQDAQFLFRTAGLLGDEYVAVIPTANKEPVFHTGSPAARAEAPVGFEQIARTAGNLAQTIDVTVKRLNVLIDDLQRLLLNKRTLTNLAQVVTNVRELSGQAALAARNINTLLLTNTAPVNLSVSNLSASSQHLSSFANGLQDLLTTNSANITASIRNLHDATRAMTNLMSQVQSGKGVAGMLLRNQRFAADVSDLFRNLSVTSSNLNRLGVWGILWRHKPPKHLPPPERLNTPKNSPFD
jgi:phospholipid/cholesterol/gamma-HCH transport system substrate-binding protein